MYIKTQNSQMTFSDFRQPLGLKMDPENRWIKKAEAIPWGKIEDRYAGLFPSGKGNPAKPLRMALGSLLIQKQYGYSDRELVEQIRENPYYQYFIGMPGYEMKAPFAPSLLVEFRKRLTDDILIEINEMILKYNEKEETDPKDSENNESKGNGAGDSQQNETKEEKTNSGTLMIDATCAPQHITYPQDISLLNEARENLEGIIDRVCETYEVKRPRTYRMKARKDYLAFAKSKKRTQKKIRQGIKKQLQYIRRDLGYIDKFLGEKKKLSAKDEARLAVIRELYEQQKTMYEQKKKSIPNRIVSISQPYIRPIVRGKAKAPTEFGAKLDMSVDENSMARIEKISFDAYNESDVLIDAAERYYERYGYYPDRILADEIYRNRSNLKFCKEHGIRLSGKPLGRPKKDPSVDRKVEYQDAVDRIEVERGFSLAKRNFGLDCIWTKLESTSRSSIVLSIIAMNVHRLTAISFCQFIKLILFKTKEKLSQFKESILRSEGFVDQNLIFAHC